MMKKHVFHGMPPGLRGPHVDSEGPCNDQACRKCDPVRLQMRTWAERKMRHQERKGLIR